MLKSFAALAEVTATNSLGVRRPVFTPASPITDIRSSMTPQPLGILLESDVPAAFCGAKNTQWAVAVVCNCPDCSPRQSASWCPLGRNGGLITYAAALA